MEPVAITLPGPEPESAPMNAEATTETTEPETTTAPETSAPETTNLPETTKKDEPKGLVEFDENGRVKKEYFITLSD